MCSGSNRTWANDACPNCNNSEVEEHYGNHFKLEQILLVYFRLDLGASNCHIEPRTGCLVAHEISFLTHPYEASYEYSIIIHPLAFSMLHLSNKMFTNSIRKHGSEHTSIAFGILLQTCVQADKSIQRLETADLDYPLRVVPVLSYISATGIAGCLMGPWAKHEHR